MKLILKNEQKPHVKRLIDILKKNFAAFDLSVMGAGKTYTATAIAREFDFERVIVVCPASVVSKWLHMKKYGLKIVDAQSYEGLRSVRGKDPKHGLLHRYDEGSKVYFQPTPKLEKLAEEGIFVIFDEAQRIKNKNAQWYACKAIAETILLSGGMSRFILLSGTPIDKQEQAINMMKMMGFIRADKLAVYNRAMSTLSLYGAQELIEFCYRIDEDKTNQVLNQQTIDYENVENVCYKLFQEVIKPSITSAMPPPKIDKVHIDLKNAEYLVEGYEDDDIIHRSVTSVNDTFTKFNRKERYDPGESNPGENQKLQELKDKKRQEVQRKIESIIYNMRLIEISKMNLFIKLARKRLEEDPNCKIALFVNYNTSIKRLVKGFEDYTPLVLDGSVDKEVRQDIIDKYQQPNLKHRVLIGNIRVCSSGIDLDDKNGKFPRYAYASPNLSILDLQQLPSRFLRMDTKSSTVFRFVYAKKYPEIGLLGNLRKKAKVMKETLKQQVDAGVEFVGFLEMIDGDYDEGIEVPY